MQRALLTEETKERTGALGPYAEVCRHLETTDADTLLNKLLYADAKTYLQELLMKQDQMSMAASIESRVPFLDHKLVEFTSRLPERLKLRGWTTDRKSTRLNSSHRCISYALFCLKKKTSPRPAGHRCRCASRCHACWHSSRGSAGRPGGPGGAALPRRRRELSGRTARAGARCAPY